MSTSIETLDLPEALDISTEITAEEQIVYKQRNAMQEVDLLKTSQGAFHDKKVKNTKVNRAQEKRLARKREKYNSRKRGKK